jgi:hypothetical protein
MELTLGFYEILLLGCSMFATLEIEVESMEVSCTLILVMENG